MNFGGMSPTELAMQIFREYLPDGHAFDVVASQEDSLLHITYGRRGEDSYHHDLDLNDPEGIERLRLEVLTTGR